MNERTEQLYKEAVNSASAELHEWNKNWRWGNHTNFEYEKVLYKKFAELIVRECCSKLKEMGESWHEFAKNPPQGQAHNASGALFAAFRLKEDAVDEIKEHFGVDK